MFAAYLFIGVLWGYRAYLSWHDLLKLQHILSGILVLLIIEHGVIFGFFDNYNRNGSASTFMLIVVAILNSARNASSFFILLIVALGYGVVKLSLTLI